MKLPVDYRLLHFTERKLVRNEYVTLQNGLCAHCKQKLSGEASEEVRKMPINKKLFPETFFHWPVHLHHDHITGMTIGAVHNVCNAVLWQHHGE
jgi:superfamily I DNA/RNA helicase